MAKWMMYTKRADFKAIAQELGISPVTARVIRNRDVIGTEETRRYLSGTLADLNSPLEIPGLKDAAFVLKRKIAVGARIRIIGDYDVDGICSSYILWKLITFLGGDVSAAIPDRVRDGYGINERLVDEAIEDHVDTIITCDNGIAAVEPLRKARAAGLTVILTDHHEIPYRELPDETDQQTDGLHHRKEYIYPPADVIAEPWIPDEKTDKPIARFPEICGAEVVFKLAQILLGNPDLTIPESVREPVNVRILRELLGFTALATVCDVMPLRDENRIIVRYGLEEASRTDNIGLRCLIAAAGLSDSALTVYHAGFVLGPCLNASGRLDSALRALALFQEQDENRAMIMARDLKQLNDSRKTMTEKGIEAAVRRIDEENTSGQRPLSERKVIIIRLDDCHESLAGIIAGRLKERYHRPAIVLTQTDKPGTLKGSGRSIEAYDMFGELNRHRNLFLKFGGHKMAAGLSISEENAAELDRELNTDCTLSEEDMEEVLHLDMELPPAYVSLNLLHELDKLEPCGTANPRPLFATRGLTLRKTAVAGRNRNVIRFDGTDQESRRFNFVWFLPEDQIPLPLQEGSLCCNVVYEPRINVWQGRESIQYIIRDVKQFEGQQSHQRA